MYICQCIQVKWKNVISEKYSVSNGVKQGGVLSPILFTNYIDELLISLRKLGVGCYIGNIFCGAFGYADDVTLLAPTRGALRKLLEACISFGEALICYSIRIKANTWFLGALTLLMPKYLLVEKRLCVPKTRCTLVTVSVTM